MIDVLITIGAWLSLTGFVLNVLFQPLMFGRERQPYSYASWITGMIFGSLLTVPMALRLLGFI